MMYIRLLIEWGAYPVWLYDENDGVIDTDLPDEWKNDSYLYETLDKIQYTYDSLFVNDGKEFAFVGFADKQSMNDYMKIIDEIVKYIYEKNDNVYHIVNDIDDRFFESLLCDM